MTSHIPWAAGYTAIFVAPALLALGAYLGQPLLAVGIALLLFPLARIAFGGLGPGQPPALDERIGLVLEALPFAYGLALAGALGMVLVGWGNAVPSPADAFQWALSLWVALVFATCVAHTLVHRPGGWDRLFGHLLAGMAGYPVLGYEHLRHHRLGGSTALAEWPRCDESVWRFAARRIARIASETIGGRGLAWHGHLHSPTARGLRVALAATAATWTAFGAVGGWTGVVTFGFVVVLMTFAVQVVTYIQHWGLGDDCVADSRAQEWGWEDDCRFQAWVTLNLSLHHAHHQAPGQPYYRLGLSANSPRLPTGYVLLIFAALVPALWRKVMDPARNYWLAHPSQPPSPGRRITCTSIYRHA